MAGIVSGEGNANLSSRALLGRQGQSILFGGVLKKIFDTDMLLVRERLQAALIVAAHRCGRAGNRNTQQDTKRQPDRGAEYPVRLDARDA